jgi:hypothetical protein
MQTLSIRHLTTKSVLKHTKNHTYNKHSNNTYLSSSKNAAFRRKSRYKKSKKSRNINKLIQFINKYGGQEMSPG